MNQMTVSPAEYMALKNTKPTPEKPIPERAVLIDVRSPAEYAQVHAEGAISLPLDKFETSAVRKLCGDRTDKPVFLICKSGERSANAQAQLQKFGFTLPYIITGGTIAWEGAGLPIVRGTVKVMSMERQVRIAAGLLVLTGLIFAHFVHSMGLFLSGFVACGLIFSGITDTCTMGMLLMKMPWNQRTGK